ncbi:hypothetical protein QBZ16_004019 [Prototheca wickerhamii]|uniref:CAAX prenyl protease 2/Lysostaphin resistance protein A-like domain-containing protein n=1 Tax=Prototheca wickerhamii TaxID=3111 RepID=A0AAD9MN66_PROWI|nr:hypothetical protein QBZ16_004019 [Prototheca wickerhamii]
MEEAVFRGFLQPSLGKHVPPAAAIGLSSLAFALIHATPNELPQLAALGALLGWTYQQTRSLAGPVLVHATWNAGVILFAFWAAAHLEGGAESLLPGV